MKWYEKINIFKKKQKECKQDEYCPIYLSYLGKYGEHSKEVKLCKNPNKQYCTKYRLVDQTEWKKMSLEQKYKTIIDMGLIEFIDKK